MMKTYRCKQNRFTRYCTAVYIVAIAVLTAVLTLLYEGGYLSAWFLTFALAIVALTVMSIPRKIVVTDSRLLVRCILDITEIPLADIVSIQPVGKRRMRWVVPVFGAVGFFGYYGHFLDIRNMRHVEIYSATWSDFIEITTIYEDVYYISCSQRDELIAILSENIPERHGKAEEI